MSPWNVDNTFRHSCTWFCVVLMGEAREPVFAYQILVCSRLCAAWRLSCEYTAVFYRDSQGLGSLLPSSRDATQGGRATVAWLLSDGGGGSVQVPAQKKKSAVTVR